MILFGIFRGIDSFLQLYRYVMIIECLMSWFADPRNRALVIIRRFTDPVLGRIRPVLFRIFPRLPLDLSPIIAFFLIDIVRNLLWELYALIASWM